MARIPNAAEEHLISAQAIPEPREPTAEGRQAEWFVNSLRAQSRPRPSGCGVTPDGALAFTWHVP